MTKEIRIKKKKKKKNQKLIWAEVKKHRTPKCMPLFFDLCMILPRPASFQRRLCSFFTK